MELHSDRLRYTKFTEDDFEDYANWYTNPEVMRYITNTPLTHAEAKKRFKQMISMNKLFEEVGLYRAGLKGNNDFVGIGKLQYQDPGQVEVGYGMLPPFWRQGFAKEILHTLMDYAVTIQGVKELIGVVNPQNIASRKILTNAGFSFYQIGYYRGNQSEFLKMKVNQ